MSRLRDLADKATPGPWTVHPYAAMEESRIFGTGDDRGDFICMCDGRRTLDYASNARLIALAPDMARLLADMGDLLGSRALHTQGTGPCDVCTLLARLRELEERA